MPINLENFSQFQQFEYYSNKANKAASNYQPPAPALKKDTFTFMGKELNKKKTAAILIGAATLIATATLAFIKRKDISKFIQNSKIKNKPIINYENLTPEKIVIPEGGYDLSKEADVLGYTTNFYSKGFSWFQVGEKQGPVYKDLKDIMNNWRGNVGVTPNGHAFVITNKYPLYHAVPNEHLSSIALISPNSEFTPAQKNLIALMQQDKIKSPNSPLGTKAQEYTKENIFDLINKWAQDIDTSNLDTQKVLSQVGTYNKGESSFIEDLIEQIVRRCHFFR